MACNQLLKEAFEGIQFTYKLDDVIADVKPGQKFSPQQLEGFLLKRGVSPKEIKQSEVLTGFTGKAVPIENYKNALDKHGNRNRLGAIGGENTYSDISLGGKGAGDITYDERLTTVAKPFDKAPKESHFSEELADRNKRLSSNELETKQSLLGWRRTHQDNINGKDTTVLNEFQSDWAQSERTGRGTFESSAGKKHNLDLDEYVKVDGNANYSSLLSTPEIRKNYPDLDIAQYFDDADNNTVNFKIIKEALGEEKTRALIKEAEGDPNIIADFPMSEKKFHQYQIVGALDEAIQNGTNRVAIPIHREGELEGSAGVTRFYGSLNKSILPEIRKKLDKQGLKIKISKEDYEIKSREGYIQNMLNTDDEESLDTLLESLDDIFESKGINYTDIFSEVGYDYNDLVKLAKDNGVLDEVYKAIDEIVPEGGDNVLHILEVIEKPNTKVKWDVYGVLGAVGLGSLAEKLKAEDVPNQ